MNLSHHDSFTATHLNDITASRLLPVIISLSDNCLQMNDTLKQLQQLLKPLPSSMKYAKQHMHHLRVNLNNLNALLQDGLQIAIGNIQDELEAGLKSTTLPLSTAEPAERQLPKKPLPSFKRTCATLEAMDKFTEDMCILTKIVKFISISAVSWLNKLHYFWH